MTETSKIEDSKIGSDVAARIASLPDIDTSAVEPHVKGTTVVLEGAVDTIMTARKVILAAETVDGVHDVENHLTLTGNRAGLPN
ncbi:MULTISPECIES: BON domain-containing protein [Rhizobiaceae]|jgi:osmotically-inducible protein OsmY|uniref:Osmotically-inducible protein OsmY n=1 Tax=Aliirhizobium cellulosilyticum TaxID=393664 RepID=A0A7W6TBD8_9HYPH|nr:BON domain-containing protein [Rhizobium cellulosilyticum]MBB4347501.1 osmotically-inducible protein OsmY [Rhizobium cellulosilyticum]MBB4410104.1 osmotically-inducible protein OsmY [Rhizobium cellulosilyticum]MBB4444791.1 osmotically-inducible protein OsmY [Rhizobium cellulosilyticum]